MYLKYNHLFIVYFASKNCFLIIVIILHTRKYDENYGEKFNFLKYFIYITYFILNYLLNNLFLKILKNLITVM